jgi:pyruvate kinase
MALLWGVRAFRMNLHAEDPETTVEEALRTLKDGNFIQRDDTLVFITQVQAHGELHESVQPRRVT